MKAPFDEPRGDRETRIARETILFRYGTALDTGDLDAIANILKQAEVDPELLAMIGEFNDLIALEAESSLVLQLARENLPSAFSAPDEPSEIPVLTVGEIAVRVREEHPNAVETLTVLRGMENLRDEVPFDLSQASVRSLFSKIGLAHASARVQTLFRETAIFLSMGRQQRAVRMAATRRQSAKSTDISPRRDDEQ